MNLPPHASQQLRCQTGFSFIETLIVLAVLSVVVVQQLRTSQLDSVDRVASGMVEKIQRVQRASMRFYRKESAWPTDVDALVANNFLTSGEEKDSWGQPFLLATKNQDLSVSSDLKEPRYASWVVGRLPRASLSNNDNLVLAQVTSLIDKPGEEAAHAALYALDGSRALTGNMDANSQNITNANTITAKTIKAQKFIDVAKDGSDTGFLLDPASQSKLNELTVKQLTLVENVKVGAECDVKTIGTTDLGKFVSCEKLSDDKPSVWRAPHELPVGSVYIAVTEDNPSDTLGYGTWESYSEGRVMVGQYKDTDCSKYFEEDGTLIAKTANLVPAKCWWYAMGHTGGSSTDSHRLTQDEMPAHKHAQINKTQTYTDEKNFADCKINVGGTLAHSTGVNRCLFVTQRGTHPNSAGSNESDGTFGGLTGSGSAHEHDIVQPYIVVKIWKRTS